jgi:thiol-disulfide isomerase/thioredoxin
MKKILLSLIIIFLTTSLYALNAPYKIEITLKGCNESSLILASYFGESFQVIDTAKLAMGKYVFKGNKDLSPGVYTIANSKKSKYFDFVIEKDQNFQIITNLKFIIDSAKILNSEENSVFFEYLQKSSKLYYLNKKIKKNSNNFARKSELEILKAEHQLKLNKFKTNVYRKYPKSILSLILTAMKESPSLPKSVKQEKRYHHYKNNYWSNIALDDPRILRTPIFYKKFKNYFDKVLLQHADTLIKEIDSFFLMHKIDDEVKKYLAWNLLVKYEYPKIMGLDKVFIHLADNYYKKGKIKNISRSVSEHIANRAEIISSILIGESAPNLILIDTLGKFVSLHEIIKRDYTIIFFWDFDCEICQKEIKELDKLNKSGLYNIDIYAVYIVGEIEEWKSYVKKLNLNWIHVNGTRSLNSDYHDIYDIYSAPTIYVLNKEKKIIAKRIRAGQLNDFLKNYELLLSNDKLMK